MQHETWEYIPNMMHNSVEVTSGTNQLIKRLKYSFHHMNTQKELELYNALTSFLTNESNMTVLQMSSAVLSMSNNHMKISDPAV